MTDKELLLTARDIHDAAHLRYLTAQQLYWDMKYGWYDTALECANRLKLHQTHPELYAEIQTRTSQKSTES